jgi:hypothetical protein
VCRSAGDTSRPPPGTPEHSPARVEPVTRTYHPGEPAEQGTATNLFPVAAERATATAGPEALPRPLTAAPRSLTATGPETTGVERLPFSPAGYELLRRLGGGGMGDVYLAREVVPQREVAMKFLRSPASSVAFERFLAEVRALARIEHPNIIKFVSTDFYREQPFFTMEYAAGGNLADLVSTAGPLVPLEAARLIACAARAVHAAHSVQVLHRDVKPSNILLSADGTVKVSDFGLAKLVDQDGSITDDRPLGTPGFMPPEQIARDRSPVGPPSDVYGLGATLYYLLTGRAPFVGEHRTEIMARVERELPDRPRTLRADVPASLEAVAFKCLEKDPARRYQTADELANELDDYRAGRGTRAFPLTRLRRARRWVERNRRTIGLVFLAVVVAAALVAGGRQLRKDRPPVSLLAPDPEQLIRGEIVAGGARLLQPDGRPRAATWPLGPEELTTSSAGGGTCGFECLDSRVLILLNDPGVDSYRVRAEIRQAKKLGDAVRGIDPAYSEVGLVLDHASQDMATGARAHILMALRFKEYDPGDGPEVVQRLELVDLGGTTSPGFATSLFSTAKREVPYVSLKPVKTGEVWRTIEARVTRAGVWVPGPKGPQFAAREGIVARRLALERKLSEGLYGAVGAFPDWKSPAKVGIWARASWVQVRNVTIEALE